MSLLLYYLIFSIFFIFILVLWIKFEEPPLSKDEVYERALEDIADDLSGE